jgi:signal transduction histidine kinase
MNSGIKLRLALLGVAVALMGALIVVVTLTSEKQANEVKVLLGGMEDESISMEDDFLERNREVNNAALSYRTSPSDAAWKDLQRAIGRFDTWLAAQRPKFSSEREQAYMSLLQSAFKQYCAALEGVHTRLQTNADFVVVLQDSEASLRPQRSRVFDFGQDLARAHREVRQQSASAANVTLTRLSLSVLGLLGLLFIFGIALAALVYRDMIAPLRLKLVESQALADRNEKLASLGLLAAGVAHEVRNPLTAVKAALFMQEKRFKPGSPELEDVRIVEREILRLERIVNDFLQFARPADPDLVTIPAELPLSEVRAFFAPQLSRSGIRLVQEPSASLKVRGDLGQLKQVLINLVRNASESIGRDGTVTLRARPDRKRLPSGETDVVILEVSDTGHGIPAEVEQRLFDPFFTTKENGTGLGLPIAARIVEKHGGILQYQTRVNQGTTFGIVLPLVKT